MTTPVAIDGVNSEYDDVNATDPGIPYRHDLIFSTNRATRGETFDLFVTELEWTRPHDDDRSTPARVWARRAPAAYGAIADATASERAPIVLTGAWFGFHGVLVFASDRAGGNGGFDLYAIECRSMYPVCSALGDPTPLALNSPADDMYLTRPFTDTQVLFASNRDSVVGAAPTQGPNDLYVATWGPVAHRRKPSPPSGRPDDHVALVGPDSIAAPPRTIERAGVLSSEADDTAPFVYMAGDTPELVFVSNRTGSLGEHDIYCSRFVRGAWQPPIHVKAASSAADELRPIVTEIKGVRFLVFSSNRPGGQGGYDLYVIGYRGCR